MLVPVALSFACAAAAPALAQYGPITINGTVASNTLAGGRFATAQVGDPVTMTFSTLPGGFEPFWGPTGRFVPVDEASYEIKIGNGPDAPVCYSAANNNALLFVNAGFVTTAVSTDEMEFFQMALDSSMYRVYFKVTDYDDTTWSSPLVANLPPRTPNTTFDFKRWEVSDLFNPNMASPGPILTITFDGDIATVCRADINEDGAATVQDIFDFLSLWFANSNDADFNLDTAVSVQDIFDFLASWFRGC